MMMAREEGARYAESQVFCAFAKRPHSARPSYDDHHHWWVRITLGGREVLEVQHEFGLCYGRVECVWQCGRVRRHAWMLLDVRVA